MSDAYFTESDAPEVETEQPPVDDAGAGGADDAPPAEQAEPEKPRGDPAIALKAERAARRAEKREYERRFQEMEARLQQYAAPKPEAPAKPISVQDDPIGALEQIHQRFETIQQQQAREAQEREQATRFQQQVAQVEATLSEYEAEFAEDHPDYQKAAEYLTVSRTQEYQAMGYSPAEIQHALRVEYLGITDRAVKANKNPAEVFYNLSKQRGFTAEQRAPGAIDKIKAGQQANAGLQGGGRGGKELTIEYINTLEGDAFDKAWSQFQQQQRRSA
ncbi:hypothetical protein [Methylocaldum sp.]|uniref:hypothetical protein n=1 Tax=Methylocaldum sp. TaxID=1969727 RepID=UPI002D5381E1|nr:hypothetical protein [Methylocaldum sp.]HYE38219.1 hypothetical protein [Methylocaldum sp.]